MYTLVFNTTFNFFFNYLQVTQGTNQIVMNCADIDIITASFVPEGGEGKCGIFIAAAAVSVCVCMTLLSVFFIC